MRKVIFIGGTSFSGSTLLDMILANDPSGFSCGEVRNFFHPPSSHYLNPQCGCSQENCKVWSTVRERGVDRLYETIFDLFPKLHFIVDSSKDPNWINTWNKELPKKDIAVHNLLIWKTPDEFAHSYRKRNRQDWEKDWISYYGRYMSTIKGWRTVSYAALVSDQCYLEEVCKAIEIPYYAGKEKYWNKVHHTLFGNTAARINLFNKEGEHYKQAENYLFTRSREDREEVRKSHRHSFYDENAPYIAPIENDPTFKRKQQLAMLTALLEINAVDKQRETLAISRILLRLLRVAMYAKSFGRK